MLTGKRITKWIHRNNKKAEIHMAQDRVIDQVHAEISSELEYEGWRITEGTNEGLTYSRDDDTIVITVKRA
jgi:hypothetical protein